MSTPTETRSRRRARRAALVAGGVAASLLVVPALAGQEDSAVAATLTPFSGCDEVDAWFTRSALERVGPWGLQDPHGAGGPGWLARTAAGGAEDAAAGADGGAAGAVPEAATGDAVGPGGTGTNVQEAGVDEPDLVKTDGRRVVTLTASALRVLDTDGQRLRDAGTLDLPDQLPQELLLLGDRALVIGHREVPAPRPTPEPLPEPLPRPDLPLPDDPAPVVPDVMPLPVPGPPSTVLTVVDLSEPSRPRVVRSEEVEAGYLSARAAAGAVRVVLTSTPVIPFVQPQTDGSGDLTDPDAAEQANRAAVDSLAGADWLPQRVRRDDSGAVVAREPAVDCASVSHPVDDAGIGTVTVLTLDAGTPDLATTDGTAVSADGGMVYASLDRLYVATTRGGWGFPMPVDGLVSRAVGSLVGNQPETATELHGFDTSTVGGTPYLASGSVPGWLLGRWAMSARDGMLRVATTVDSSAVGTEAVVTVLAEQGAELVAVGSVGGLGEGEQIRAVRWFEDLAVVVTFRQTDPLYTVDLSEPTAPTVLGELKIPGYSAYLHPVGGDLVLGVGQDATDTGRTTGAQVSSFDLGDLAAPTRVDTLTYRDTWSDAESDSRAFSYLPGHRVALLPLSTGDRAGVVAVSVGPDGALDEAGRWTPGGGGWAWVARAVPVGPDAVVVLTETERGRVVTLVSVPALGQLDEVRLG